MTTAMRFDLDNTFIRGIKNFGIREFIERRAVGAAARQSPPLRLHYLKIASQPNKVIVLCHMWD